MMRTHLTPRASRCRCRTPDFFARSCDVHQTDWPSGRPRSGLGQVPNVRIRTFARSYAPAQCVLRASLMDAVNFSIKRAHLALLRLGRSLLTDDGLTPARFDLMNALGPTGAKQSDLCRQLEVVRSVVSEMLASLEKLGWIERVREGRTKLVKLTAAGREVFERADKLVTSGEVGACVDQALALLYDSVVLALRQELIDMCTAIRWRFRAHEPFAGPPLYVVLGSPS